MPIFTPALHCWINKSATQDCQQAMRAFAEKSSVSFHNQ